MKYLTKEWYNLCQQTGLHHGMRVHKEAYKHDEALYQRLYKRKEREYIKQERDIYNVDPRVYLEHDGINLVPLHQILDIEEVEEQDMIVYHMSAEEKADIEERIAEYDARPPFNEEHYKQQFSSIMEYRRYEATAKLPKELISQVADMRVYALGYCTKEVYAELKKLSKANQNKVESIMDAKLQAQQQQRIPESIRTKFNLHDCKVTTFYQRGDLIIRLDPRGGFTNLNKITFVSPQILMLEEGIVGSDWLYDEIYHTDQGYEVHVLLWGKGLCEFIVRCHDIVVEEEFVAEQ